MKNESVNNKNKSGEPIRAIFMGTPDFSVKSLGALLKIKNIEIVTVITQTDKPVGRKQIITPAPVKIAAEKHNLKIIQPQKIRDPETIAAIKNLNPDLIVVAAYGKIIPKEILEIPRFGAVNVHASLLPKYRGASPIQTAIALGEKETGITIMLMDEFMDHGQILSQEKIRIENTDTGDKMFEKLSTLGAELLSKTLSLWIAGKIMPKEQDHSQATACKILNREDGKIDWNEPAEVIERKIRAYDSWPGTWTIWNRNDKPLRLNIFLSKLINENSKKEIGIVFKTAGGFAMQCGKNSLEILELQSEGKNRITSKQFLNGYPDIVGSKLN